MMWRIALAATLTTLAVPRLPAQSIELEAPIRVLAGGAPIDVEIGHAAPFVGDFDLDGVRDLLVGQFGSGKLRIYRNSGTDESPKFKRFEWFQAGGGNGKVPSG